MLKRSYKDQILHILRDAEAAKQYLETDRVYYAFNSLHKLVKDLDAILDKAGYYQTDDKNIWIDNIEQL